MMHPEQESAEPKPNLLEIEELGVNVSSRKAYTNSN